MPESDGYLKRAWNWLTSSDSTPNQDPAPGTAHYQLVKTAEQAGLLGHTPTPGWTPHARQPLRDEHNFPTKTPTPGQIELMAHQCHELAATVDRVVGLTLQHPISVESSVGKRCPQCGTQTEHDVSECPTCAHTELEDPDPTAREVLENKAQSINQDAHTLEDLVAFTTRDASVHDTGYIVFKWTYQIDNNGSLSKQTLEEVRRGDPRLIEPIVNEDTGQKGGLYICLTCRNKSRYNAQESPEPCPDCGSPVYEAWYAEHHPGGSIIYYLPGEVHPIKLHGRGPNSGASPVVRLWDKLRVLLWMDRYAVDAFNPYKDKAPRKMALALGVNADSFDKQLKEASERLRENPYAPIAIGVPTNPTGDSGRPVVEMLNFSDTDFKGQSEAIRERILEDIRREYGVSQLQSGNTDSSGGLNNEGLQLRSTAQVIDHIQRQHHAWFRKLEDGLGVRDWQYTFGPSLEEDEARELDTTLQKLQAAREASELGLTVRWEGGDVQILDGEVEAPEPSGGGGFNFPMADTGNQEDSTAVPDVQQGKKLDSCVKQLMKEGHTESSAFAICNSTLNEADSPQELVQAAFTDDELAQFVDDALEDAFGGPSAARELEEAVHPAFQGLQPAQATEVKSILKESLSQPQGWSVQSITNHLEDVFEAAGVENPRARARNVARTETAVLTSKVRERQFEEQSERDPEARFRVVGPSDRRTTKLSHWLREQTSDGLPINELKTVLDEGVNLAKQGAFTEEGRFSNVPGEPIELPGGFRRRGFVTHFNDRDTVVRARGGS